MNKFDNEQNDKFYEICLNSNKWVKWVGPDFIPNENKKQLVEICGHYQFSNEEFLKLISQKRGEISGILISSKKIEDKTITEIEKAITSNIKHSIKLKTKIDESLIGGIVIQIGSLMIDTSIKNKLQKYKKLMSEA